MKTRSIAQFALASLVLWLPPAACVDNATQADDSETSREEYPAGPYGTGEGEVIDNLAFTGDDGLPFTLERVYRNPDMKLLLITTAAGWCVACIEEQAVLQSLYDRYGERGLAVVSAVFEDEYSQPANAAYVSRWRRTHKSSFSTVADEGFILGRYYDSNLTPMVMFVDVDSMRILSLKTGFDRSLVEASINAKL